MKGKLNELHNSVDFGDKNVLSYCYEKHAHKAHEYRKKNEQIFSLMKDHFPQKDYLSEEMKLEAFRTD